MDFGLSEEQELLQATVRGFTANETPPAKVREVFDGDSGFDRAVGPEGAPAGYHRQRPQ